MNSLDICNAKVKMRHLAQSLNYNVKHNGIGTGSVKITKEATAIRMKYPTKLPIIIDRYFKEFYLPNLDKRKFLVPQELTMSQFVQLIRNRLDIGPHKAIFLLVNNHVLVSLSKTMSEVYAEYKAEDGFLYVTYTSQEVFGYRYENGDQQFIDNTILL